MTRKDKLTGASSAMGPAKRTKPIPAQRNVAYEEYYYRWGYLPPGFDIEINGKKIVGGCAKWRAYADQMGYPKEPPPWAPEHFHDAYKLFLDKTYRPWMHGDLPIQEDLYYGDWNKDLYEQRRTYLHGPVLASDGDPLD